MTNAKRPEKSVCDCSSCITLNNAIDYFESDAYIQSLIDTGRVAVDSWMILDLINDVEMECRNEGDPFNDDKFTQALAASSGVIKVVNK